MVSNDIIPLAVSDDINAPRELHWKCAAMFPTGQNGQEAGESDFYCYFKKF